MRRRQPLTMYADEFGVCDVEILMLDWLPFALVCARGERGERERRERERERGERKEGRRA